MFNKLYEIFFGKSDKSKSQPESDLEKQCNWYTSLEKVFSDNPTISSISAKLTDGKYNYAVNFSDGTQKNDFCLAEISDAVNKYNSEQMQFDENFKKGSPYFRVRGKVSEGDIVRSKKGRIYWSSYQYENWSGMGFSSPPMDEMWEDIRANPERRKGMEDIIDSIKNNLKESIKKGEISEQTAATCLGTLELTRMDLLDDKK